MKEIKVSEYKTILIDILKEFDKFCRTNNLKYSLAYGTLLGSLRHKGFIPWDDDVDVMMLRDDYELFIKTFEHPYLKLIHHSMDNGYPYPFLKLYDSRTIIEEQTDSPNNFGLYVDIFPIDGLPNNFLMRKIIICFLIFLRELLNIKNMQGSQKRSFYKNFCVRLMKKLLSPVSSAYISARMNKIAKFNRVEDSRYAGNLLWCTNKTKSFDISIFKGLTEVKFENLTCYGLTKYDEWLNLTYGDYMQLPPENSRVSNHSFKAYRK